MTMFSARPKFDLAKFIADSEKTKSPPKPRAKRYRTASVPAASSSDDAAEAPKDDADEG